LVGQLAAHWGNADFAEPTPYESVVRAAFFHDYGWLAYETNPLMNPESRETYEFRGMPFSTRQLDAYQWCSDWMTDIDRYSGLIINMHRTGLWQGRYNKLAHPASGTPKASRPEIHEFIQRNEARQKQELASMDANGVWTNFSLLQVWDVLGLYFCCQEPYNDYIEPVPVTYDGRGEGGVRMTMRPVNEGTVEFKPYPFNVHPLKVQIMCKHLPAASFCDEANFRRLYFQASNQFLQYELV
jgi:hypothetical protein